MVYATGNNESSVGVGILDCDHREMAEAWKELHAEIATGWKRSRAGHLLRSLSRFTLLHFALEEGMMDATGYPGIALHRANHQRLIEHLNELVFRYDQTGLVPETRRLDSLNASHRSHVHGDDLNYGRWLNCV
jgi:hemerythrin